MWVLAVVIRIGIIKSCTRRSALLTNFSPIYAYHGEPVWSHARIRGGQDYLLTKVECRKNLPRGRVARTNCCEGCRPEMRRALRPRPRSRRLRTPLSLAAHVCPAPDSAVRQERSDNLFSIGCNSDIERQGRRRLVYSGSCVGDNVLPLVSKKVAWEQIGRTTDRMRPQSDGILICFSSYRPAMKVVPPPPCRANLVRT